MNDYAKRNNSPLYIGARVKYYQFNKLIGYGTIDGIGIKNDQVVFDVILKNGASHWGYRDQFEII